MIFTDFAKAVAQLSDPRFVRVFVMGILLTMGLLFGAYVLVFTGVSAFSPETLNLPLFGEVNWIGQLFSWGSLLIMIALSVFLMIPVASAITSLFLDEVAQAVEDKHYPHLHPAQPVGFWDGLRDTINFLGVLLAANAAALMLTLFLPFLALPIFYGVNGYLLGREYFTLVATRRIGRDAAKDMRGDYRGQIWMAGILMALPLSVPLMNLVIPVLGAATFTHLFHRLAR